jgi:hypothetical protein
MFGGSIASAIYRVQFIKNKLKNILQSYFLYGNIIHVTRVKHVARRGSFYNAKAIIKVEVYVY